MQEQEYYFAVGKRKNAVSRVKLQLGSGKISIDGKSIEERFPVPFARKFIEAPFEILNLKDRYNVEAMCHGGGVMSQLESVRHGITKALVILDPSFKHVLRQAGFVTRDPREKERKKPGLKRARRAPQWSKR